MSKLLKRIAIAVSKRFLKSEYLYTLGALKLLHNSVLTYDFEANPNLFRAVQAAEDRQFMNHSGFHLRAIARAAFAYISRKELQGGSTIEQQLVRVVRNRYEITVGRKISEIILATAIGDHFKKSTILEMYLEVAYFGWRGNGIRQICDRLDFQLSSLNLRDACLIAALIKAPMPKNPSKKYIERMNRRIEYILKNLERPKGGLNS